MRPQEMRSKSWKNCLFQEADIIIIIPLSCLRAHFLLGLLPLFAASCNPTPPPPPPALAAQVTHPWSHPAGCGWLTLSIIQTETGFTSWCWAAVCPVLQLYIWTEHAEMRHSSALEKNVAVCAVKKKKERNCIPPNLSAIMLSLWCFLQGALSCYMRGVGSLRSHYLSVIMKKLKRELK